MTTTRAGWLTLAVLLLAAWGALAAGSRVGARTAGGFSPPAPLAGSVDGAGLLRVGAHRGAAPGEIRIRRDPFRFPAPPVRRALSASVLADVAMQALASAPVVPPGPEVDLIGLAESREGGRIVRTAVLSVGGDVLLAREGSVVANRYRVARVTADSVYLEGADGGQPRVLRLR